MASFLQVHIFIEWFLTFRQILSYFVKFLCLWVYLEMILERVWISYFWIWESFHLCLLVTTLLELNSFLETLPKHKSGAFLLVSGMGSAGRPTGRPPIPSGRPRGQPTYRILISVWSLQHFFPFCFHPVGVDWTSDRSSAPNSKRPSGRPLYGILPFVFSLVAVRTTNQMSALPSGRQNGRLPSLQGALGLGVP